MMGKGFMERMKAMSVLYSANFLKGGGFRRSIKGEENEIKIVVVLKRGHKREGNGERVSDNCGTEESKSVSHIKLAIH